MQRGVEVAARNRQMYKERAGYLPLHTFLRFAVAYLILEMTEGRLHIPLSIS